MSTARVALHGKMTPGVVSPVASRIVVNGIVMSRTEVYSLPSVSDLPKLLYN